MEDWAEPDACGVDPGGGQNEAGDVEVGGGKPDLAAEVITVDHAAGDRVRAAEQGAGLGELSVGDQFPDPGGTDDGVIERDRG